MIINKFKKITYGIILTCILTETVMANDRLTCDEYYSKANNSNSPKLAERRKTKDNLLTAVSLGSIAVGIYTFGKIWKGLQLDKAGAVIIPILPIAGAVATGGSVAVAGHSVVLSSTPDEVLNTEFLIDQMEKVTKEAYQLLGSGVHKGKVDPVMRTNHYPHLKQLQLEIQTIMIERKFSDTTFHPRLPEDKSEQLSNVLASVIVNQPELCERDGYQQTLRSIYQEAIQKYKSLQQ